MRRGTTALARAALCTHRARHATGPAGVGSHPESYQYPRVALWLTIMCSMILATSLCNFGLSELKLAS